MSAQYTVKIQNPTTGDIFELPFNSIDFTEEVNGGKDATFGFDYLMCLDQAKAYQTTVMFMLSSSYREIWVEKNGTKIFYGAISDVLPSKNQDGSMVLIVHALGFFSLLQKRRTSNSQTYTATDAADIAWSLINTSQTADSPYSDFGITRGTHPATVPRTITYNFAEIRQSIIDLSNAQIANGFDFDIDVSKVFNIYYPYKGSLRSNIVLDDQNIMAWGAVKPGLANLTNKVYVVGKGVNTDVAYVYISAPVDYKSAFKVLEDVISDTAVDDTTILTDEGNQYLKFNQAPIYTISVTHNCEDPDITTYDVGDSLLVTIPELSLTQAQYRVKKRSIKVDLAGQATTVIDLQSI